MSAKPMFDEYGIYVDGKIIGSVCDNQLFFKPTVSGCAHAEAVWAASPYEGSTPQMLIAGDRWAEPDGLASYCASRQPTAETRVTETAAGRVSTVD